MSTAEPFWEVLDYGVEREVWLAERRKGIGGSDIAALLGMSRWSTPLDVWLDKTGQSDDKDVTWRMMVGNALEGPLLEWFRHETGVSYHRVGLLRNAERPIMQVSLDAALTADSGIAECKVVSWRLADEWDEDQVADPAELQVQWALGVTGRSHGWAIAAIGEDAPTFRRIERNQPLIDIMTERAEQFWAEFVLTGKQPPLSAGDRETMAKRHSHVARTFQKVTGPDAIDLRDWVEERKRLQSLIKDYKGDVALIEAKLIDAIGDASELVLNGKSYVYRRPSTSTKLDTERLATFLVEHGATLDDFRNSTPTRRLYFPAKPKDVS